MVISHYDENVLRELIFYQFSLTAYFLQSCAFMHELKLILVQSLIVGVFFIDSMRRN